MRLATVVSKHRRVRRGCYGVACADVIEISDGNRAYNCLDQQPTAPTRPRVHVRQGTSPLVLKDFVSSGGLALALEQASARA